MADKERLELIKDILDSPGEVFFGSISDDGVVSQDVTDAEPYFKWLVERVQELEGAIKGSAVITNIASARNKELEEENKRYREAIESVKNKLGTVQYREYQTVDFRHEIFSDLVEALERETE